MNTLEDDLKAYYRSCRVSADPSAKAAVADLAADEWGKARAERGRLSGGDNPLFGNEAFGRRVTTYVAFVAGQARFMSVRSWLLQAAVVALVALVAWIDPSGPPVFSPVLRERPSLRAACPTCLPRACTALSSSNGRACSMRVPWHLPAWWCSPAQTLWRCSSCRVSLPETAEPP